jgi:hypothetical protein
VYLGQVELDEFDPGTVGIVVFGIAPRKPCAIQAAFVTPLVDESRFPVVLEPAEELDGFGVVGFLVHCSVLSNVDLGDGSLVIEPLMPDGHLRIVHPRVELPT